MLKKLIATGLAGATLLATAVTPGYATGGWDLGDFLEDLLSDEVRVDVHNEDIDVRTTASSYANTGENEQEIEGSGGINLLALLGDGEGSEPRQRMTTGNATAETFVGVDVATTEIPLCDCLGDFDGDVRIDVHNDDIDVRTEAWSEANTGYNEQEIEEEDGNRGSREYSVFHEGGFDWEDLLGGGLSGRQSMSTGNARALTEVGVRVAYTNFGVED